MTLNTLYDEVRALGFEDGGTPDGAFVFAANRALLQIAAECKEKRRGTFPRLFSMKKEKRYATFTV